MDEYILIFRFTRDGQYSSEVKIESKSKLKEISDDERLLLSEKTGDEWTDKIIELLKKGNTCLDLEISLSKEIEVLDDIPVPGDDSNGFEEKEHQGKYKRISVNPVILDGVSFREGLLDETVCIKIKSGKQGDSDRKYYIVLLKRFFDWEMEFSDKFQHGEISLDDYLNHVKSNAKFEIFVSRLFKDNIKTFNFDVNAVRGSMKSDQSKALNKDGSNLHYVLEYLKNGGVLKEYDQKQFEIISASLTGIVDEVEDITVEEQRMGLEKIPEITFKEKEGFEVARTDISDGTLALLATVTGLYAFNYRHYLVAVEEPERHLHMNAISYLMEVFRGYSEGTQLIITTQSSEVLRNADLDSDNLVFIYRDNKSMTKFLAAGDVDEIKTIMEKFEYNADDIVRGNFLGYLGDYEQTEQKE
ncbi:MAG: AAA family ATPase [bacterium]|nr:AAA family ATPase [bacterium]